MERAASPSRGHSPAAQAAQNERGLWELPGGSVELGERLIDALRREIHEEYGFEIEVGALLDVVDHILPEEGQHWVSPVYVCSIASGSPRICEPDKCTDIGWFLLDDVPPAEQLTQISRRNLARYRERLAAGVVGAGAGGSAGGSGSGSGRA